LPFVDFFFAYWWLMLIEGLAVGAIIGVLTLAAPKLVRDNPRSLTQLKVNMALTAVAIFLAGVGLLLGVSDLIAKYYGISGGGAGLALGAALFVALLMILQWLFSPYIINLVYRTRPPQTFSEKEIEVELQRLARASGVKPPRLRIAEVDLPNAFAYGSPLVGNYVAVTRGLLRIAPKEEIIAVLGHEVGHLKHRDVAWILALSLIPLAIYYLGRMLIWSSFFTGFTGGYGDEEEEGGSSLLLLALGVILVIAGVIFKFLVAHFNRLREYYADAHSAIVTGNPRWLQRALARIHMAIKNSPEIVRQSASASIASQLFIVAPLIEVQGGFFYDIDYIVDELKREKSSAVEELFSDHPPIPKRLRFLDEIANNLGVEVPVE
jgi:heat shock protein HtpX